MNATCYLLHRRCFEQRGQNPNALTGISSTRRSCAIRELPPRGCTPAKRMRETLTPPLNPLVRSFARSK
ncbi:MAG: hypothetical protein KME30_07225 [Iphinoe sp. HA4291-MV1]|nr:hypothetical protein [Iphinoe sp. HA4291-MV1]